MPFDVDFTRGGAIRLAYHLRRCILISKQQEQQINEEIRDPEVRLISEEGEQLGIMSAEEALALAQEKELDLVKIAPMATPPVCKIMDYGKFRFEKAKKEKEARKNQKIIEIKEIRLSLNIDTHDYDFKIKNARKFLADGNKLKISIRFRGREMAHPELGTEIMDRAAEDLGDIAAVDKPAKLEGRQMLMFMSPKVNK
jgi:translation initiation factor IF-3